MSNETRSAVRGRLVSGLVVACLLVVGMLVGQGATALKAQAASTGWNIVASPNTSASDNLLFGTTCINTGNCWAVGWSDSPPDYQAQALAEEWDGANWTIVSTPSVGTFNLLQSVSCVTSVDCWAAGYDVAGGIDQTLVEQYTGGNWVQALTPNPASSNAVLTAITCVGAGDCWAVGYSWVTGGLLEPLIEQYEGGQWTIVGSPTTATAETPASVTCADANHCWMVGSTLIEQWNGSQWSIVGTASTLPVGSGLTGVTCVGVDNCWAVGSIANPGTPPQTLILQFEGSSWTVQSSPNAGASATNNLQEVSCISLSFCIAAGTYSGGSAQQTLIEQYNGTSWSIIGSPNTSTTSNNTFLGVSCMTGGCWSTGYSAATNNSDYQTLIEQYTSPTTANCTAGTWAIDTAAMLPSMGTGSLYDATVATPSLAWAVGTYASNSGSGSLIMTWTGGTSWSVVGTGGAGAALYAVTSFGAKSAFAVGDIVKNKLTSALVSHWNGSTWTRTVLPVPSGATAAVLEAVGGSSATNVWAAGLLIEHGSTNNLLLEHYNGSTWTRVTLTKGTDSSISANAILAFSSSDVWLLSDYGDDGGLTDQGYLWHYNGHTWTDQHTWPVTNLPSSAVGLAGSSDHDLWTVTYNYGIAADVLEHWNGVSWAPVGVANPNVSLNGIAEGAQGPLSLWSVGNVSDLAVLADTYIGEDGDQTGAPTLSGVFNGIATGKGLAFAVGYSVSGSNPVVESSCD